MKPNTTIRRAKVYVLAMALSAAVFVNPADAAPNHKKHEHVVHGKAERVGLQSRTAFVMDQSSGKVLFEKNAEEVVPIASISKLMSAMVVLDAKQDMDEVIEVSSEDVDVMKGSRSRLSVGTRLPRKEMLRLALMSSENRATSALSRNYPGGKHEFVLAMNRKSRALGLENTKFEDPTGLDSDNVSTAKDLSRMVAAAYKYGMIRDFTTTEEHEVVVGSRQETFRNTNPLVRDEPDGWSIGLSKTGYISEAGRCLVMQARIAGRSTIMVFLDSGTKNGRTEDARKIGRLLAKGKEIRTRG